MKETPHPDGDFPPVWTDAPDDLSVNRRARMSETVYMTSCSITGGEIVRVESDGLPSISGGCLTIRAENKAHVIVPLSLVTGPISVVPIDEFDYGE